MREAMGVLFLVLVLFLLSLESKAEERVVKKLVNEACVYYGATDCDLVHAIVMKESSYRSVKTLDIDKKFVYGPLQIKCGTAKANGLKFGCEQLYKNPMIGLRFGIAEIERQLKRYKGNIEKAVAGYNAGKVYICKKTRYGKTLGGRRMLLCYTGEYVNQEYIWKVVRYYKHLKRQKEFGYLFPYMEGSNG